MGYSRLKIPRAPSQRAIRNWQAFASGGTSIELPAKRNTSASRKKPKKQAESAVSEANREWVRWRGGVLRRNRRGMVDMPGGGKLPFGLSAPFIQDDVGYLPVRITASMVGKVLPIAMYVEAKTDSGVVEKHQQEAIEELRDANCIAGVSRNAQDMKLLVLQWLAKVQRKEGE